MLLLLLSACAGPATQAPQAPGDDAVPKKAWSQEESQEIAERLLRRSPTYSSRCIEGSLRLLSTTPLEEQSWQFAFEFQCQHPGYGWLGDEPTPQVVTSHQAQVIVQGGEVTYAVLDDKWDVLAVIPHEAPIAHDGPEPSGAETDRPGTGSHGTTTGSSVSVTHGVGTWTWTADGDYVWFWFRAETADDVELRFGARSVPISVLILAGLGLVGVVVGIISYRRRRKRKGAAAS